MKKIAYFMCALLLAACTSAPKVDNGPVLTVEGGQIQGVAADIPGITVYGGIPYAAAPIGDLRWKEPQPVEPWDGVLLCNEFGHPGYQAVHYPGGYFTEWGYGEEKQCSEDCLYLNVWTPAAGKKDANCLLHTGSMAVDTVKAGAPSPSSTVRNSPTRALSWCPSTIVWVCSASWPIRNWLPKALMAFPVTTVSWI